MKVFGSQIFSLNRIFLRIIIILACLTGLWPDAFPAPGLNPDSTGSSMVQQYVNQDQWHGYCLPVRACNTHPFIDIRMTARWYDEPEHSYKTIVNPAGDSMLTRSMLGYWIFSDPALGDNSTISVTGKANSGPVSIMVTNTAGPEGPDGWNLIGNPYPSGIYWSSMALNQVDPTMYIFDPSRGNYVFWNAQDLTHTSDIQQTIPAMQGFFVHCHAPPPGTGSVSVDNFARVHIDHFLYQGLQIMDRLLILSVYGNGRRDEAQIWFSDSTSELFEWRHDVYKRPGDILAPQLYSELPDSTYATLNAIPWTGMNRIIPMGFKHGVWGTDTIVARNLQSFADTIPIWIHDLTENRMQLLTNDSVYVFTTTSEGNHDRFRIVFGEPATGVNGKALGGLSVWSFEKDVYVIDEGRTYQGSNLRVSDPIGRNVFSGKLSDAGIDRFCTNLREGYYVVEIVSSMGEMFVHKIFIR